MNHHPTNRLFFVLPWAIASCADASIDPGESPPGTTHATTNDEDGLEAGTSDSGEEPHHTTGPATTGDDPSDDTSEDDTQSETGPGMPLECIDQMILDLGLIEGRISEGAVTNTPAGAHWVSTVDASAGGISEAPQRPWIYLRFTPEGLKKVELDDIQALHSTDWDIAAKRFGLRLNGGSGGPSSIAATAFDDTTYEEIRTLPDDAILESESFYDEHCMLVGQGDGLGSPLYVLGSWWSYPGCVSTTSIPFIVGLANGEHIKLVVDSYYQSGQAECNESGMMGVGSANFSWRWAYLE